MSEVPKIFCKSLIFRMSEEDTENMPLTQPILWAHPSDNLQNKNDNPSDGSTLDQAPDMQEPGGEEPDMLVPDGQTNMQESGCQKPSLRVLTEQELTMDINVTDQEPSFEVSTEDWTEPEVVDYSKVVDYTKALDYTKVLDYNEVLDYTKALDYTQAQDYSIAGHGKVPLVDYPDLNIFLEPGPSTSGIGEALTNTKPRAYIPKAHGSISTQPYQVTDIIDLTGSEDPPCTIAPIINISSERCSSINVPDDASGLLGPIGRDPCEKEVCFISTCSNTSTATDTTSEWTIDEEVLGDGSNRPAPEPKDERASDEEGQADPCISQREDPHTNKPPEEDEEETSAKKRKLIHRKE